MGNILGHSVSRPCKHWEHGPSCLVVIRHWDISFSGSLYYDQKCLVYLLNMEQSAGNILFCFLYLQTMTKSLNRSKWFLLCEDRQFIQTDITKYEYSIEEPHLCPMDVLLWDCDPKVFLWTKIWNKWYTGWQSPADKEKCVLWPKNLLNVETIWVNVI